MKPSLRSRYFGWLILLILTIYIVILAVFFANELHESRINYTPIQQEYPELLAIIGIMLLSLPATLIVAWNVAGRLLRPLNDVLFTAERIRQGNLDERIPPSPNQDELATLADTINDAFDRYASAVRRLEHFSADASHQLKTPLAAINTLASVSLQRDRSIGDYQEALGEILEQTDKLNHTIEQLLMLSRMDESVKKTFEPFDLLRKTTDWMNESSELLHERGIQYSTESSIDSAPIFGNETLLREVFNNLLNNAMSAITDGGKVAITIRKSSRSMVEWCIEDSGPGIDVSERERIFDRFYRGRSSSHTGSGLGLAIVKEIIQLHNGSIRAGKSEKLDGASFEISIPQQSA